MSDDRDLAGLTFVELSRLAGGSGRAKTAWRAINDQGDPRTAPDLGQQARDRLAGLGPDRLPRVRDRQIAACGTTKLAIELRDDAVIEVVLIPTDDRTTVCVSTQVGCGRGCVFCVTASLGLRRSLSAAEIVRQVLLARATGLELGLPPVRNVVYMGMGEPFDNLLEVQRSIEILTHPHCLALPPRHITVSTVGTSPQAIAGASELKTALAWSLPACDDELRRQLVPSTRHSLADLRAAFLERRSARSTILFVETTLILDVNDSRAHARALVEFLKPFGPDVRVNLLPCNPGRAGCRPSSDERVCAFRDVVTGAGIFCMVRRPRGQELGAACGQLAART